MKTNKNRIISVVSILIFTILVMDSSSVQAEVYDGVELPDGDVAFADAVIDYTPTDGVNSPYNNPDSAIDVPDGNDVSLGDEGVLILQFTDNSLTTSGDDSNDLWVFEIGPSIEPTSVSISVNGRDWIEVGQTEGSTSGIDIDSYIDSGVVLGEKYSFVKITDLLPHQSGSPYTGADIDAVGAISSDESVALIANAGSDQVVSDKITLDGSGSYPSDQIVSYQWQIQHRDDSQYDITVEGVNPEISDLTKGFYDATLTVTNYEGIISTDKMLFSALPCEGGANTQADLEAAEQKGYDRGYQEGLNASCDNPITPISADNCATFDVFTNTFHVPCFNAGTAIYWLDWELTGSDPIGLELKDIGSK